MSFVRCATCNGKKSVMGLGMLEKECPTCYGVGYIDPAPKEVKKAASKKKDDVKVEG